MVRTWTHVLTVFGVVCTSVSKQVGVGALSWVSICITVCKLAITRLGLITFVYICVRT